jgi:hypothetical protein
MAIRRFALTVTSDSSGDATVYSPYLSGKIRQIQYVKTDYADTVDFTITSDVTGATIWTEANVTAAKVCAPRIATHSNAGVAALYASGGTAVNDMIALGRDRVKIVINTAGATKTGVFHVVVED